MSWKKNSQCRATWRSLKILIQGENSEKAAFPPSTHKPGTAHQKSPQVPKPGPPVQRTVQDTPRHCGCTSRAADRSCLEARQRRRHTNVSECPRYHLKGTAPWKAQKPHPCPDCWQIPPQCLDSSLHWRVCRGGDEKLMAAAESMSNTQMVTPLLSRFLVAFSAPAIELRHWPFVHLQSTC